MPELPEVESLRRLLAPHLEGRLVLGADVRERRLRAPIAPRFARLVCRRRVRALDRRGKYLVARLDRGALLLHLGMSGNLRLYEGRPPAPGRHDHVDLRFEGGRVLRLRDPRRFGLVDLLEGDPEDDARLRRLGPEPLDPSLDARRLREAAGGRATPIWAFLQDARRLAGVGNIYAAEALHVAGVHPLRPAGRLSLARWKRLLEAVREVLLLAIEEGGTTLRDHGDPWGRPGGYGERRRVYGREGEACLRCGRTVKRVVRLGRSAFFCPGCQF